MNLLPPELLKSIFNLLDYQSFIDCRLVCYDFNKVINDITKLSDNVKKKCEILRIVYNDRNIWVTKNKYKFKMFIEEEKEIIYSNKLDKLKYISCKDVELYTFSDKVTKIENIQEYKQFVFMKNVTLNTFDICSELSIHFSKHNDFGFNKNYKTPFNHIIEPQRESFAVFLLFDNIEFFLNEYQLDKIFQCNESTMCKAILLFIKTNIEKMVLFSQRAETEEQRAESGERSSGAPRVPLGCPSSARSCLLELIKKIRLPDRMYNFIILKYIELNKNEDLFYFYTINDYNRVKEFLIEKKVNINFKDDNGRTLLYHFYRNGINSKLIRLAVENGADVNSIDNNKVSIFDYATLYSDDIKPLLNGKLDLNYEKDGVSIFLYIFKNKFKVIFDDDVLKYMIENVNNINQQDSEGNNALQLYIKNYYSSGVKLGGDTFCASTFKLLIEKGCNIHNVNKKGRTVLNDAISRFVPLDLIMLLTDKNDIKNVLNIKNHQKNEFLKSLFNKPFSSDTDISHFYYMLEHLVENREIDFKEDKIYKENNGFMNICIDLYPKEGDDYNQYFISKLMKLIIKNGSDVNYSYKGSDIPLFKAVKNYKQKRITNFLLENGADVNFIQEKTENNILQHCFQFNPSISTIESLIKYGANVNHVNKSGHSVLTYLLYKVEVNKHCNINMHLEIIKLLVENGANVKFEYKNQTILQLANRRIKYGNVIDYLTNL
uniref:F-box domain-containing protein n=1 Tax=viral metagenome TaxID=1070528 RepID=A0A6C0JTY9_9ZZZZ